MQLQNARRAANASCKISGCTRQINAVVGFRGRHWSCEAVAFIPTPTIEIMNDPSNKDHCISVCNGLLRGERSAVETYTQAIEKHSTAPAAAELTRILGEHKEAVTRLADNVRSMGGEPDTTSGAWGVFAKTVQATSNLFGAESAIGSLQKGEESGRSDYEEALLDDEVMIECKQMIREELLPRTIAHIAALEQLARTA